MTANPRLKFIYTLLSLPAGGARTTVLSSKSLYCSSDTSALYNVGALKQNAVRPAR